MARARGRPWKRAATSCTTCCTWRSNPRRGSRLVSGAASRGKTLADMNDRTGLSIKEYSADMATIEQIVGVLTAAARGAQAGAVLTGLRDWLGAQKRSHLPGSMNPASFGSRAACGSYSDTGGPPGTGRP
jgi:hypothetical protein